VVNLASRLSDRAAVGQILIGQHVFGATDETVDTAPVGELELKGFGRPISAYEVLGFRTDR
jgi:class 3 adenylate cyclase